MERCCDRRVVCHCLNVTEDVVVRAVADFDLRTVLRASGGLAGLFSGVDHRGVARYPLLPDGREAVELDFFDFVLEERDVYWHIDTDRYAAAVLRAPRVTGRPVPPD